MEEQEIIVLKEILQDKFSHSIVVPTIGSYHA